MLSTHIARAVCGADADESALLLAARPAVLARVALGTVGDADTARVRLCERRTEVLRQGWVPSGAYHSPITWPTPTTVPDLSRDLHGLLIRLKGLRNSDSSELSILLICFLFNQARYPQLHVVSALYSHKRPTRPGTADRPTMSTHLIVWSSRAACGSRM